MDVVGTKKFRTSGSGGLHAGVAAGGPRDGHSAGPDGPRESEGKKLAVHRDLPTTEFKGRDEYEEE